MREQLEENPLEQNPIKSFSEDYKEDLKSLQESFHADKFDDFIKIKDGLRNLKKEYGQDYLPREEVLSHIIN